MPGWTLAFLRRLHDGLRRTEQIYMVLIAVVIGLLAGLGAVGFRELIRLVNEVAWHEGQYTIEYLSGLPAWWKILAPAAGGLAVGLIGSRLAGEVRGHGVPEVMEAVALKGGRIRPRVVLAKLFASGICIGSGGSVGREGPIVQIGSALGSATGQWLKVDQQRLRTLVGCGAAAGIAATFNAPVAGALFAVEIILGDFGVSQFSPIVISSVVGTVVSQHFLGDFPAFDVPHYSLVHANELFAYAGLGLLAGLVALAFIRVLYGAEDLFERTAIPLPLRACLGGALVGVIGLWLPHVFGVGYEAINEALNGTMAWRIMVILVLAKLLAVAITIGSGGSGGVFAPSLFMGAMLGGSVGTVVHAIWPESTATPGAYALVGMGAVVAAGTHAPITAIVIIFELTNEYRIILPLMISCIIATLLATWLQPASIYTLKLLRRGIDIHGGRAVNVLQGVRVREQMRTDPACVDPGENLVTVVSRFMDSPGSTMFVVNGERRVLGVITQESLRPVINNDAPLDELVIAQDLMGEGEGEGEGEVAAVSPDDSLADVMKLMGNTSGELPVVENGRLVGVVWPQDVIDRYNRELFRRDMARGVVSAVSVKGSPAHIPTVENAVVTEVAVPASFVGRSIRDLDIRGVYGCSVLMIRRTVPGGDGHTEMIAAADHVFQPGDVMVVLGPRNRMRRLKHGR